MEFFEELPQYSLVIASIIILITYFVYHKRKVNYWADKGIPYDTPIPFVGSSKVLRMINSKLQENEEYYYKKYGTLYGSMEGYNPMLNVGDPDLVYQICIKDFAYFVNHVQLPSADDTTEKMLFNSIDDEWKRMRSVVTPTFTSGKMRKMGSLINYCLDALNEAMAKYAAKGETVDVSKVFGYFTMNVIASTAFATKIDAHNNPNSEFVKHAQGFFTTNRSLVFAIALVWPKFVYYLSKLIPSAGIFPTKFFKKIIMKILEERKNETKEVSEKRNDFLQLLMDAGKNLENQEKSNEAPANNLTLNELEIFAQAITFLVVGFDTTATSIGMAVYEISKNPNVQKKVLEEIDRVLKESNGKIDYDVIKKMEYLDAVFSETLRLHPVAISTNRMAAMDYKLPGKDIVIEKGMRVNIPLYPIHRDNRNFERAEEFIPERFLPGSQLRFNKLAYFPFGQGPRSCIAMRFALMEAKMCLAGIYRRFTLKFDPKIGDELEYLTGVFLVKPITQPMIIEERKVAQ